MSELFIPAEARPAVLDELAVEAWLLGAALEAYDEDQQSGEPTAVEPDATRPRA